MTILKDKLVCSGIEVEVLTLGEGEPLLFLHGGLGPDVPNNDYLYALAKHYRVIAPYHPGFGHLPRVDKVGEVADLAYLYLDMIEQLGISQGILVGASFGGWIAAEMMVRKPDAMSRLVLVSPLGIKVRGREDRDIEDFFSITYQEFCGIAYADPKSGVYNIGELSDDNLATYFRAQESLAAYGWRPYMHNPNLKHWLHRIVVPTLLVSGEADRFVFDGYHHAYANALPKATHQRVAGAGHFPHMEKTEQFVSLLNQAFNRETIAS
ncbi:alpha/beta fold hydrolase [Rhizobium lusitanum]|uniref:alpha/beta fold hydrolase n=1 Tax=Rhizobium lusitanum TaxID=293958 RepID=UPI0015716B7D|nr:alpha/beta hydrolase [Rhizobium lusitanum]NTJ11781.1 alpha/beta hydrolase [Rhizobium lusitanum]